MHNFWAVTDPAAAGIQQIMFMKNLLVVHPQFWWPGLFAYDLYDIAVTQILLGPIGFVAGVASMAFAAILAILYVRKALSLGCFLLSADTVVQSFGVRNLLGQEVIRMIATKFPQYLYLKPFQASGLRWMSWSCSSSSLPCHYSTVS